MSHATASLASIDAVWRIESARLIAGLTRWVRDISIAEELAQDALLAAIETWPAAGIPENPGAWLMTTAKNRGLDQMRKRKMVERKHQQIQLETDHFVGAESLDEQLDDDVGDDLLRLVFVACHPILSMDARVALTLRLLGGLTTEEIARAFLTSEPTIAQRIVRAKRTLSEANVPFEVPRGAELFERLGAVLEVIYLIFNEGYSASSGDDWLRPALCEEALRLGRILAALTPTEPETHGLAGLMEIQASRIRARTNSDGDPILLLEQDRGRWDYVLIQRGLNALVRANALGGRGFYVLQAEIAACHARARVASDTDWARIAALYAELNHVAPSPIVELNRAVAVSMIEGPEAGLQIVDRIAHEPALQSYPFLEAVRGDFLMKTLRFAEAKHAFEKAASLTRNQREKELLLSRAASCENR